MKRNFKVFLFSLSLFLFAMAIGGYTYLRVNNIELENNIGGGFYENFDIDKKKLNKIETKKEQVVYDDLKQAIANSNRVNFLILGMEDVRTDTIIFASFCPDTKSLNLINIPRDTYIYRDGYNRADQRKINSVYGSKGVDGLKVEVSKIFNVPIDYYVSLDYKAVENIVDNLGGIEVNVPIKMEYRDPTSKPPLLIDIPAGMQKLDGEKSLQFLRYRKGINNEGYIDGDIGRIKAQQEFLKSFIGKASDNKTQLIKEGLKYIKTDISLLKAISYSKNAMGMDSEDFKVNILPGKAEFRKVNKELLSYYIYNQDELNELLKEIYNVKVEK